MSKCRIIAAVLAASLGLASALAMARTPVSIPDSAPGRALVAWLDAFNSGDAAREQSFREKHALKIGAGEFSGWRASTGGYELLAIYSNDRTTVFFRVKAKLGGVEEVGRLTVAAATPTAIEALRTWPAPPDEQIEGLELDAATRGAVVRKVAAVFDELYVFPETGKKMSAALLERDARGDYRSLDYGIDLAARLASELRDISDDEHVDVRFSFSRVPAEIPKKTGEEEAARMRAANCGFEKVERLESRIGYVKFNLFADPDVCAAVATAAMDDVSDRDALILDLRDNRGGRAAMVDFIASYLFADRTHLYDTAWRRRNSTQQSWSSPSVPGRKFIGKPVYVLISKRTFSAAEGLAIALQDLKRATLIGEPTAGGAHRVEPITIADHFIARVPTGRTLSPVTRTDWEGKGVVPDVAVPEDEALGLALKLAADAIGDERARQGDR